jgi:hypothetical protein
MQADAAMKKGLASIEQNLMNACDSISLVKFEGKLKTNVSSTAEMRKENFLTLL